MNIGDTVEVLPGAMEELRNRGWMADYITKPIDGMTGEIVQNHGDIVGSPHVGVELGFEWPVGIPHTFLRVVPKVATEVSAVRFER